MNYITTLSWIKKNEIQNFILKFKNNIDDLNSIKEYLKSAIDKYEYSVKENKLKEKLPNYDFTINSYSVDENMRDLRITMYLVITVQNIVKNKAFNIVIGKTKSISEACDDILEDFHILLNNVCIVQYYGEKSVFELFDKIHGEKLDFKKRPIDKKIIYELLLFFDFD